MSVEEAILQTVRALPAAKQREVLDHATRLLGESSSKSRHNPLKGLWADLHVSVSEGDIADARKEMWKPRYGIGMIV